MNAEDSQRRVISQHRILSSIALLVLFVLCGVLNHFWVVWIQESDTICDRTHCAAEYQILDALSQEFRFPNPPILQVRTGKPDLPATTYLDGDLRIAFSQEWLKMVPHDAILFVLAHEMAHAIGADAVEANRKNPSTALFVGNVLVVAAALFSIAAVVLFVQTSADKPPLAIGIGQEFEGLRAGAAIVGLASAFMAISCVLLVQLLFRRWLVPVQAVYPATLLCLAFSGLCLARGKSWYSIILVAVVWGAGYCAYLQWRDTLRAQESAADGYAYSIARAPAAQTALCLLYQQAASYGGSPNWLRALNELLDEHPTVAQRMLRLGISPCPDSSPK